MNAISAIMVQFKLKRNLCTRFTKRVLLIRIYETGTKLKLHVNRHVIATASFYF